eukprot:8483513-Pyramimonas_sp.AAC.1
MYGCSHATLFGLLSGSRVQEWLAKFQCVITGDDVANGKPDPEIFEKAASFLVAGVLNRALGSEPGPHCVVFEDAPGGGPTYAGCSVHYTCLPNLIYSAVCLYSSLYAIDCRCLRCQGKLQAG